jgi:hypothetical protein
MYLVGYVTYPLNPPPVRGTFVGAKMCLVGIVVINITCKCRMAAPQVLQSYMYKK